MEIIDVNKTGKYCLDVTFADGSIRTLDCTDKVRKWYRENDKNLIMIAENFGTAYVNEDGNIAFRCGKDDLFISASEVFRKSTSTSRKATPKPRIQKERKIKHHNLGGFGTISSQEVMKTDFVGLPFTGGWRQFLGEPASNFYMILSAQPGHGKSTFCLKFGNYLTKFGRVLYITNEEDAGRIKSKLKFVGDRINDFDISFDAKTKAQVISLIEMGNYNFVFIDSAQYGGMDYKELREIREMFPDIAIIAICRQTKTGTARGSQEKEYDGDITVVFDEPGHARTVKNRFWELSDFQLF